MTRFFVRAGFLVAALAALPAHAQGRIEPGEWEQVMTMTAPGMPGGSMKRTMRQCMTSADVAIFSDRDQWAAVIADGAGEANCKLAEVEQKGTAMLVRLECEGDMQMTMRHDFQGTTGTIDAETFVGGTSMSTSHVESKRVAATCSDESIAQWKQQNPGKTFAP
jgi:hypothetical protein